MPKLLTIFVFLGLSACQPINQTEKISGHTMGTTYTIIAQTNQLNQQAIERRLNQITQVFSSWDYNSELSILNRQAINTPKSVSAEMAFVLAQAINVHKQTEGFFNPSPDIAISIFLIACIFLPSAACRGNAQNLSDLSLREAEKNFLVI